MPYATLADIAKRANKSIATVSRVLNGKAEEGIPISEDTKQQILQLAKELNYRPNFLARHLVQKDSRVIGLLIPDIMQIFFNEICYHLSRKLDEAGYDILLAHSYEDPEPERRAIEMILSRRVNGIVVAPAKGQYNLELLEDIRNRRIPLILLDRYFVDRSFYSVTSDDVEGSYSLVRHLIDQGARRILFLCGDRETSVTIERIAGYRKAFQEHRIGVEESLLVDSGFFQDDGHRITRRLLSEGALRGVDAIMGVNDEIALGVLEALWEGGIEVPRNILVAGYGDERYSKYLRVPLTSVQQPTQVLAEQTYKLLMKLINRKSISKSNVKVPCQLVVRESTVRSIQGGAG
jgi:LacI family transcriptional regulator